MAMRLMRDCRLVASLALTGAVHSPTAASSPIQPPSVLQAGATMQNPFSLSGSDWRIHDDPDGNGAERRLFEADTASPEWIAATVPGNIQADLESAHLIPPFWFESDDPLLAKAPKSGASISWAEMWNRSDFTVPGGDPRLAVAARKDWWYRKDFIVPQSFAAKRVKLVFDGVDHECEVYLNSEKVGGHGGMYRRVDYDVGILLKPGQINRLAVRIARIPPSLERHIGTPSQIKAYRHELSEIKCPSYGLDWGIGVYSLGIWKDVRLEASGPARIDDVHVQTRLDESYRKATIVARLEVDSPRQLAAKGRFRIEGHGVNVSKEVGTGLSEGINKMEVELDLDRPALWWPSGQGDQPLYQLTSELVDAQGTILHSRTTRFGVREIKWVQVESAPDDASVLSQLVVNGRKVRLMGSNMIPADLLPGRQHAKADWLLRMVHAAGMNVVRLWGGGVTMRDEWYGLADELGIMIQQEMPTTNSGEPWPEEYSAYTAALERTAISIIKQLRNHPCIVEWTGGNEMGWPGNDSPIPTMLRRLVTEMDGRIFRLTDPEPGWAHGPYSASPEQFYRSYNAPPATRRGEFGAPGPAHLETWHRDIPPASQWPLRRDDPVLVVKNILYGWIGNTWLQPHVIESLFGPLPDLPSLIKAGQWISADELRYAMDAMRRAGLQTSGFMNWVFNEPWSNGAGNTVVDYDGRPLMNYYFAKQALAPISLSLKFDTLRYKPGEGLAFEVWLTSDSPHAETELTWKLLARDRHGKAFATDQGQANINPLQARRLKAISIPIPAEISYGPILVETQLLGPKGEVLQERLQPFGCDLLQSPFRGLLLQERVPAKEGVPDAIPLTVPRNLAGAIHGAKPATATSSRTEPYHQPAGINDGKYGNQASWIPVLPKSSFHIELCETAEVDLFKLSRDRNGQYSDRWVDYLKIETSLDRSRWQTVFEQPGLKSLPDFNPGGVLTIRIDPVRARFLRVTVEAQSPATGEFPCIDEFEAFATGDDQRGLPRVSFAAGGLTAWRPVARTALESSALPLRVVAGREILELRVKNAGSMTALFCLPHPLIEYRTDLFIDPGECSIPPGQARTITIRSAARRDQGPNLAQTGWRVSSWNADDVVIEPRADVLLTLGRRDAMCREFGGYLDPGKIAGAARVRVEGPRPDPAHVPCLLDDSSVVQFAFELSETQAKRPARLRVCTADQSAETSTKVLAMINGHQLEGTLPVGLGLQRTNPPHLAFPATLDLAVPAGALRLGENLLQVRVQGDGWFSWDALWLTQIEP